MSMTVQDDYRVSLEAFQGPLDLLLYLIRRAEVDIHDIPLAEITDQYLQVLRSVHEIDVDHAAEFLVMASSLIELKSRTLAPREPDADAAAGDDGAGGLEAIDPRTELVRQLLAYQRYRTAAEMLETRRDEFALRYAARPPWPDGDAAPEEAADGDEDESLELEDVHVLDLSRAYERMVSAIDFDRLGDHHVEIDDTPIELYEEDLLDRLHRREDRRLTLQQAFEGHTRGQRIGMFLATLELVRLRRVTVIQPEIESPIELLLNDDPGDALVIETDEIVGHEAAKWAMEQKSAAGAQPDPPPAPRPAD